MPPPLRAEPVLTGACPPVRSLNISSPGAAPGKTPLSGSRKRRRVVAAALAGSSAGGTLSRSAASSEFTVASVASGDIEIVDTDATGSFIKLKNSSDKVGEDPAFSFH